MWSELQLLQKVAVRLMKPCEKSGALTPLIKTDALVGTKWTIRKKHWGLFLWHQSLEKWSCDERHYALLFEELLLTSKLFPSETHYLVRDTDCLPSVSRSLSESSGSNICWSLDRHNFNTHKPPGGLPHQLCTTSESTTLCVTGRCFIIWLKLNRTNKQHS